MKSFLTFLIFSVCLSSCLNKAPYSKETVRFNNYLKENYNKTINEKRTVYFIIPTYYCKGCKQYLVQFLQETEHKATLITVDNTLKHIPKNIKILYDKKQKIDRVNLGIGNVMLIVTKDKNIQEIKEIKPGDNLKTYKK